MGGVSRWNKQQQHIWGEGGEGGPPTHHKTKEYIYLMITKTNDKSKKSLKTKTMQVKMMIFGLFLDSKKRKSIPYTNILLKTINNASFFKF